ncbi:MAG: hypothetical protein LBP91_00770 [Coriobacteriales bacterium]|jgi:hypothetical protein|nr:hypothetical protein [Coriobacteriales bacterium]
MKKITGGKRFLRFLLVLSLSFCVLSLPAFTWAQANEAPPQPQKVNELALGRPGETTLSPTGDSKPIYLPIVLAGAGVVVFCVAFILYKRRK